MSNWDVIVIGAGAAGLHCAAHAAKRGKSVLVLDHAKQAGKKILISGGGRCNFTNMYAGPDNFLSSNPHFCKSALSRYTQWDFIGLVAEYGIPYHEKTLGQLFCDDSAKDIVRMLMSECDRYGARVQLRTEIMSVDFDDGYCIDTSRGEYRSDKLVVACGGLSMPKLGATPLGYQIAEQFGHSIVPVRAGLVPFTLQEEDKERFAELSGVAVPVTAEANDGYFREAMLFTHRGVSGPAILQVSSYWQPGEAVTINLLPDLDAYEWLKTQQQQQPKSQLNTVLQAHFPKRVVTALAEHHQWPLSNKLADTSNAQFQTIADNLNRWQLKPNGTEGYRTAEVTLGGVNVDEVSSKTMESQKQPGLYFIGEVLDVTGWLGGFNFQWAWSSGFACGSEV
ncbi:NAD(P)/FAD-dependent oxidoreductase [Idiomarina sp.]|jgi:predicted Rossmann fold flavoprotein|uniref:NAD(P)/FAD-dependent oxidoreductase n=1 Tax=Idiomarina sp. TaxID=1874361 RepID=UPI001D2DCD9D|nr:NAD(P)/FAD-dependent oxidoreductase [Idiomarina sp.]MCH2454784.1 NAD(P)/FAD-dependent oxidoreductase [Idiomarina sp.]MCJ8317053.1 NAD(P)/FAD-dependent oxidoreductase [Idiomarina sp.]NQZ16668.1 NAD(P)/FAD-dependent oxidoreductase [Idiomarina sp.]